MTDAEKIAWLTQQVLTLREAFQQLHITDLERRGYSPCEAIRTVQEDWQAREECYAQQVPEHVRITRQEFRADPGKWVDHSTFKGRVTIVDDEGTVRMRLGCWEED